MKNSRRGAVFKPAAKPSGAAQWLFEGNLRDSSEHGYHLIAGWDGKEIWIDVNGERTSVPRSGAPTPSGEPLELGLFEGVLNDVSCVMCHVTITYMFLGASSNSVWLYFLASSRSITAWSG